MRKRVHNPNELTWRPKKRRPIPIEEQFASPVVARAMAEISRQNEELRRWREERKGKRIEYKQIKLVWR